MNHTDSSKFKNTALMVEELKKLGLIVVTGAAEADIVYMYNLYFLANTYQYQNESQHYRPRGIRGANGKFPT